MIALATATLFAGSPASPQAAAPNTAVAPPAVLPVSSDVGAAYDTFHLQPMWFRNGVDDAAVGQLAAILQRAPFDGFPEGPQLAAQVQAAVSQARANPASAASAERILSTALVRYVQALRRPTDGMIYAFPVLKPQGTRAEEILLTAAAAPSLASYLAATSDLNPIYKQLRDAGWAEAQDITRFCDDDFPADHRCLLDQFRVPVKLPVRAVNRNEIFGLHQRYNEL